MPIMTQRERQTLWMRLRAAWASSYTKYYLLAGLIAALLANLLDVRLVGTGPLDADATAAIGTWFAGMLTVITIAIAADTFREDRLRAAEQSQKEAQADAVKRREDAGAIFCWLSVVRDEVTQAPTKFAFRSSNRTDVPVYEWSVAIEGERRLRCSGEQYGPLFPGAGEFLLESEEWKSVARSDRIPRVEITFKASTGEVLTRTFDGTLAMAAAQG